VGRIEASHAEPAWISPEHITPSVARLTVATRLAEPNAIRQTLRHLASR